MPVIKWLINTFLLCVTLIFTIKWLISPLSIILDGIIFKQLADYLADNVIAVWKYILAGKRNASPFFVCSTYENINEVI